MPLTIAIDVANTQARAILIDPEESSNAFPYPRPQKMLYEQWELSKLRISSDVINKIVQLAEKVAGTNKDEVRAIGVACTGAIDSIGKIHPTNITKGNEQEFLEPLILQLEEKFHVHIPIAAGNRSTLAAWGEYKFGLGKSRRADNLVFLNIGSGVGAGIVTDRQLYMGSNGFAGQVGHLLADHTISTVCPVCGQIGCLSAVVGGNAIIQELSDRKSESSINALVKDLGKQRTTGDVDSGYVGHVESIIVDARSVVKYAVEHDNSVARQVVSSQTKSLGRAVAQIAALLDPDLIVLGGIVYDAEFYEYSTASEGRAYLPLYRREKTQLLRSQLRDLAPLYGAAVWVWNDN